MDDVHPKMRFSLSPPPPKAIFSSTVTPAYRCSSDSSPPSELKNQYRYQNSNNNNNNMINSDQCNMQRQEDTNNSNSNIDVQPNGEETSSDYKQWLHAMKLVARLPGGIPPEFRRKLWLSLADKYLKSKNVDWAKEEEKCFCEKWREDDEELGIQIVKDLHRTGSTLCTGPAGDINQAKLKRILLGYARYNPEVGYCQGFNMLGALILQVMDKEESESIKVMIYLVEGILPPGYFCGSMGGLQADMGVFRELMQTKLPRLAKHLQKLQGPIENAYEPPLTNVFTMQWFLTLFCTCLPMSCVLRVWDLVLIEGSDVLLRTALALWSLLEERVLSTRSADDFYGKMGSFSSELLNGHLIDSNGLIEKVVQLGPIPDIQKLRDKHLYNVAPLRNQQGLHLYYDDDEPDMDEDSRLAVATVWGIPWGRRGSQGQATNAVAKQATENKERIALDISLLKKQYDRLRERQKQAHIILTTACSSARQGAASNASSAPLPVNQLLSGRPAIVTNRGRRIGPPAGAIPPARKPSLPAVLQDKPLEKQLRRGETLHWRDTSDTRQRRDSLTWKEIKAERASMITSGSVDGLKSQKLRTRRLGKSDSSSYSEESDDNDEEQGSSPDTSLCDEENQPSADEQKNQKSSSKYLHKSKKLPSKERKLSANFKENVDRKRPKSWAPSNSEIPFVLMTIDSPNNSADENPEQEYTESGGTELLKEGEENNTESDQNRLKDGKDLSWKDTIYSPIAGDLAVSQLEILPNHKETSELISEPIQLSPISNQTAILENSKFASTPQKTHLTESTNSLGSGDGEEDEIKMFDVSDEGVTNEYFERVNSTERPTKLDLLYSLNEEESIRDAYKIPDHNKTEHEIFATADETLNKSRCMDLLVDYSEKSSAACIAEAKTEISTTLQTADNNVAFFGQKEFTTTADESVLKRPKLTAAEKRRNPRRQTLTRSSTMDIEKRYQALEKRLSMEVSSKHKPFYCEIDTNLKDNKCIPFDSTNKECEVVLGDDIRRESKNYDSHIDTKRKIPSTADLEERFKNMQLHLVNDRQDKITAPCDSENAGHHKNEDSRKMSASDNSKNSSINGKTNDQIDKGEKSSLDNGKTDGEQKKITESDLKNNSSADKGTDDNDIEHHKAKRSPTESDTKQIVNKSSPTISKKEPPDNKKEDSTNILSTPESEVITNTKVKKDDISDNEMVAVNSNSNKDSKENILNKQQSMDRRESNVASDENQNDDSKVNEDKKLKKDVNTENNSRKTPPSTEELEKRFSALEKQMSVTKSESNEAQHERLSKSVEHKNDSTLEKKVDKTLNSSVEAETNVIESEKDLDITNKSASTETYENNTKRRSSEPPSTEDLEKRYETLKRRMSSRNFESRTFTKTKASELSKNKDTELLDTKSSEHPDHSVKKPATPSTEIEEQEILHTSNLDEKSPPSTESLEKRYKELQSKPDNKESDNTKTKQSPDVSVKKTTPTPTESNKQESRHQSLSESPPSTDKLEQRYEKFQTKSDNKEPNNIITKISTDHQSPSEKSLQSTENLEKRYEELQTKSNKEHPNNVTKEKSPERFVKRDLPTSTEIEKQENQHHSPSKNSPPSAENLEKRYDELQTKSERKEPSNLTTNKPFDSSVKKTLPTSAETDKKENRHHSPDETRNEELQTKSNKKETSNKSPEHSDRKTSFTSLETDQQNSQHPSPNENSPPPTEKLEKRYEELQAKSDKKESNSKTTKQSPPSTEILEKRFEKLQNTSDKNSVNKKNVKENSPTKHSPPSTENLEKRFEELQDSSKKMPTAASTATESSPNKVRHIEDLVAKIKIPAPDSSSRQKRSALIEELQTKMKGADGGDFVKPSSINPSRRPPAVQATLLASKSFNDETLETHATSAYSRSGKYEPKNSTNRKMVRRFSDLPSRADLENRLQFLEEQLSKTLQKQRRSSDSEVASKGRSKHNITLNNVPLSRSLEYRVQELEKHLKENRTLSKDLECKQPKEKHAPDPDIEISQIELAADTIAVTGKELVRYSQFGEVADLEHQNPINISINIQMTLNKEDSGNIKLNEIPKTDELDRRLQILEQQLKTPQLPNASQVQNEELKSRTPSGNVEENIPNSSLMKEVKCESTVHKDKVTESANCLDKNINQTEKCSDNNETTKSKNDQTPTNVIQKCLQDHEVTISSRDDPDIADSKNLDDTKCNNKQNKVDNTSEVKSKNAITESKNRGDPESNNNTGKEENECGNTLVIENDNFNDTQFKGKGTKTQNESESSAQSQQCEDTKAKNTDKPTKRQLESDVQTPTLKNEASESLISEDSRSSDKEKITQKVESETNSPTQSSTANEIKTADPSQFHENDSKAMTQNNMGIDLTSKAAGSSQIVPIEVNKKTLVLLLDNEPKAVKVRRLTRANTEELEDLFQALEKQLTDRGHVKSDERSIKADEKLRQTESEITQAMAELTKEIREFSKSEKSESEPIPNKSTTPNKPPTPKKQPTPKKPEEDYDWGTDPIKYHLKKKTVYLPSTKELDARFRSLERQIKLLEDVEKINVEHRLTEIERKIKLQYSLSHEKDLNKFLDLCEGKGLDEISPSMEIEQERCISESDQRRSTRSTNHTSPKRSNKHVSPKRSTEPIPTTGNLEYRYRALDLKHSSSKQNLKREPIHPLEMLLDPSPDESTIPTTGELEHRMRVMDENRFTPSPPSRKSRSQSPPQQHKPKSNIHMLEEMVTTPPERNLPTAEQLEARLDALQREQCFNFKMQKNFREFNQKLKDVVSPSLSFDEPEPKKTVDAISPKTIRFRDEERMQSIQRSDNESMVSTNNDVVQILEENSKIIHRFLKKTIADSHSSTVGRQQSTAAHEGLGVRGIRLMRETSPLRRKGTHTGIPLRTGENINDQLTSIQNSIKSIDSLCEEKPYRKERCQQYIDALFSDSTYFANKKASMEDLTSRNLSRSTSREIGPSIRISDHSPAFTRSMGSADSIRSSSPLRPTSPLQYRSNRDLRREPSPRRRREEDREEYESRVRRDNLLPNNITLNHSTLSHNSSHSLTKFHKVDSQLISNDIDVELEESLRHPTFSSIETTMANRDSNTNTSNTGNTTKSSTLINEVTTSDTLKTNNLLDRPISPYRQTGLTISNTPVYTPAKLEIRHTTVTSTFYDRVLTEKQLEKQQHSVMTNRSPMVSPLFDRQVRPCSQTNKSPTQFPFQESTNTMILSDASTGNYHMFQPHIHANNDG